MASTPTIVDGEEEAHPAARRRSAPRGHLPAPVTVQRGGEVRRSIRRSPRHPGQRCRRGDARKDTRTADRHRHRGGRPTPLLKASSKLDSPATEPLNAGSGSLAQSRPRQSSCPGRPPRAASGRVGVPGDRGGPGGVVRGRLDRLVGHRGTPGHPGQHHQRDERGGQHRHLDRDRAPLGASGVMVGVTPFDRAVGGLPDREVDARHDRQGPAAHRAGHLGGGGHAGRAGPSQPTSQSPAAREEARGPVRPGARPAPGRPLRVHPALRGVQRGGPGHEPGGDLDRAEEQHQDRRHHHGQLHRVGAPVRPAGGEPRRTATAARSRRAATPRAPGGPVGGCRPAPDRTVRGRPSRRPVGSCGSGWCSSSCWPWPGPAR